MLGISRTIKIIRKKITITAKNLGEINIVKILIHHPTKHIYNKGNTWFLMAVLGGAKHNIPKPKKSSNFFFRGWLSF